MKRAWRRHAHNQPHAHSSWATQAEARKTKRARACWLTCAGVLPADVITVVGPQHLEARLNLCVIYMSMFAMIVYQTHVLVHAQQAAGTKAVRQQRAAVQAPALLPSLTAGSVSGSFSPAASTPSVRSTPSSALRPSTPCVLRGTGGRPAQ